MKRTFVWFGAVFVSLLLLSNVSAVPQTQSQPAMDLIEQMEDEKLTLKALSTHPILSSTDSNGLIDLIIQIITMIINFVITLINFVTELMGLIGLIQSFIDAIFTLIDLVNQFIQMLNDLFNPQELVLI